MQRYFLYSIFTLVLIFLTGFSLPVYAENAADIADKDSPAILVMGDSLSAGFGINTADSWVTLLHKRLQADNFPHRVINASISGETSSGGLSRLPAALIKHQPTIVLIELGANDGLRGLPLELMRKNLSAMIDVAQKQNARVLLIGMKLPPNYGPLYTGEFAETFAELAQQHKTGLVPFLLEGVATQRRLMQSDGLHPTAAAQDMLLDTVWPHLLPLLNESKQADR